MDGITMGRFIFYNPHAGWFLPTYETLLGCSISGPKYKNLFMHFYENEKSIYVVAEGYLTVAPGNPRKAFLKWAIANGLNPLKFKILNISELRQDDVLFMFQYTTFNRLDTKTPSTFWEDRKHIISSMQRCKAFKVVHLTHYFVNTGKASKLTELANIDLIVSEANLSKHSKYFKHFYPWYKKDVYTLPFIPDKRFCNKRNYEERKNKAIACGSISYSSDEVKHFFGVEKLQPMRQTILDNKKHLENEITSFIVESFKFSEFKAKTASRIQRFIRAILVIAKAYLLPRKPFKHPLTDYDIVANLNSYKMAVVPEEIIDVPGITFEEAMLCGTAYIGKRCSIYDDYGMIEGKHFIAYDGTLEDLVKTIRYYQTHQEELEQIAKNGERFATHHFSAEKICNEFVTYCLQCAKER